MHGRPQDRVFVGGANFLWGANVSIVGNPIDIRTPHDAMAAQASSHSTVYIMVNRPAAEIAIASAAGMRRLL